MPDDQNPPMEGNITIVLVDDHTMMREGTRRLLEEDAELQGKLRMALVNLLLMGWFPCCCR